MKTYIYRLHFDGPVHFGETGIGMENANLTLGSDSLTSAVINSLAVLNEADEAVKALTSDLPGFLLSNLFPFGPSPAGEGTLYALPRPLAPPPVDDPQVMRDLGKKIKRIAHIDSEGLLDWLGELPLTEAHLNLIIERGKHLSPKWDPSEKVGWYAKELRPRVSLDRSSSGSAIWHCGAIRFHKDAGLYGLVRVAEERWFRRLEAAFRLLGELGLGGERTYGMGSFRFSGFEPLDAVIPNLAGKHTGKLVLLSNYFPAPEERERLHDLLDAWDFLETRGYVVSGRTATKIKRKRLRMILCGSVAKRPLKGTMVEVTPDQATELGLGHRVYRSGLAFTIPEGGTA